MSIQERIAAEAAAINFPALDNLYPVNQREFVNPVVDLGLPWSRYGDAIQASRRSVDRIPGEIEGNGAGRAWALHSRWPDRGSDGRRGAGHPGPRRP